MSTTIAAARVPDAGAMHALVAELEQRMNALRGAAVDHQKQISDAGEDLERQRRLADLDRIRLHKEVAGLRRLRDQLVASKADLDDYRKALDAEKAQVEQQWRVLEEQRRLQAAVMEQLEAQRQRYAELEGQLGQRGVALGMRVARLVDDAAPLLADPEAQSPATDSGPAPMALAA